jgi:hypothetical protein
MCYFAASFLRVFSIRVRMRPIDVVLNPHDRGRGVLAELADGAVVGVLRAIEARVRRVEVGSLGG